MNIKISKTNTVVSAYTQKNNGVYFVFATYFLA